MSDWNSGRNDPPSGDQPDPGRDPFAKPQPPPDPPAYAPPAQGQPYGQQPYGQQPYAPQPYGVQQPYGGYAQRDPDKRPGTVTGAVITAWVMSVLSALMFAGILVGLLAARDEMVDALNDDQDFRDLDINADDLFGALVAITGGFLLWCVIAIVLALFAYRRSNFGRHALAASSVVSGLLGGLTGLVIFFPFVYFVTGIIVTVLLYVGGANEWYARRGSQQQPTHTSY